VAAATRGSDFLNDAFTRGSAVNRTTTIYYTMSTWNPYAVVLMKSTLAESP
jgi:hypothetical protein